MPSGHTSATFASAAVLQDHFGWKVGVPSFAVAGFVGWTRIRDQHHWLTDVLVGAMIGFAVGYGMPTLPHYGRGQSDAAASSATQPLGTTVPIGPAISGVF